MTKLAAILDQIDSGSVLLRSLYLSYRSAACSAARPWQPQACGVLILDGQQRITSLYGITGGRPPAFFQDDEKAFSGLRFNVEDQTFEFYAPTKMRDHPQWIDVTSLFTQGFEQHIGALNAHPDTQPRIVAYMERLARLRQVLERDFHEEKITGEDKDH